MPSMPHADHTPPTYFPAPRAQHFCSQCGARLARSIPPDDNRVRDVCHQCGAVHYQNPRLVVGTLPVWEGHILLCRRAIEPRLGYWTLPAGFMELDETTAEGALRETQEEAGAQVTLGPLYTIIDVPQAEQVHCFFLAHATSPDLDPGPETLEAQWVLPADIPWDEIAFRTVATTLERYLADQAQGHMGMHYLALPPRP